MGEVPELSKGETFELAKMAYILQELKGRLDALRQARRIQGCYPSELREELEARTQNVDRVQAVTQLCGMNPASLEVWEADTLRLIRFAETLSGNAVDGNDFFDEQHLEGIGQFIKILYNLKPKSKQQMFRFLKSIQHNEPAFILVENQLHGVEVRFRYRITSGLLDWFTKSGGSDDEVHRTSL